MVYLMASTGRHSGGFNDNITMSNGASIAKTYRPESLYAIEIGSKNEFLDRKAQFNVSAFDYEYTDIQFQTVIATGPTPTGGGTPPSSAVRDNVSKARVIGAEVGGQYQAPLGLTARVDALILDSRFLGDTKVRDGRLSYNLDPATQMVSLDGKWLPKSSRLTLNYSLSQTLKTPVGYFDWIASAQTRTKYYLTVFNGEGYDMAGNQNAGLQDSVDTYTRIDLGVGHTRPDGKLRFEGFVNNLTNIWYATSLINVPNLNLRFVNPPRQFGVRVTVYL
jgi:iron complex outermembrane recepter protein